MCLVLSLGIWGGNILGMGLGSTSLVLARIGLAVSWVVGLGVCPVVSSSVGAWFRWGVVAEVGCVVGGHEWVQEYGP